MDLTSEYKFNPLEESIAVDLLSAKISSFLVSPFVTILDQAISCNASGKRELFEEIKLCAREFMVHPIRFCKSPAFLWVWALYASTYAAHNLAETVCFANSTPAEVPKFASAAAVNMTMVLAKDRAFARMFGTIAPTKLPLKTYGLFACRDLLTVFASFSMPEKFAKSIPSSDPEGILRLAQFMCPLAVQFVSTPLHLLGLDYYNRRNVSSAQRMDLVASQYWKSSIMRSARIIPAFSIGSVCNLSIRKSF
jgi:hypothetical protein